MEYLGNAVGWYAHSLWMCGDGFKDFFLRTYQFGNGHLYDKRMLVTSYRSYHPVFTSGKTNTNLTKRKEMVYL